MSVPAWLRAAALAEPQRFTLVTAAQALPELPLRGPRSLALARSEVQGVESDPPALRVAVCGLAGAQSPLPAGLAHELAALEPATAAAGLIALIEERLLYLLVQSLARRAVDDPSVHRAAIDRLVGPLDVDETMIAGRICDGPTADAVATRLAAVAGCPVRIHAATGGSLALGPGASDRLGAARLGSEQTVGGLVHAPELGCRIELGPVAATQADALRPGGARHAALLACLARALPDCLCWELALHVTGMQAQACGNAVLGRSSRLDGAAPASEREILARNASPVA